MIGELTSMGGIPGRVDAGKGPKVMNKMCLVEIPAVSRYNSPIYGLFQIDHAQDLLKAPHPAKQFWCEPNLFVEELNEPPCAQADLAGDLRDCPGLGHLSQFRERKRHRRVSPEPRGLSQ